MRKMVFTDLTGQKFGRLTVVARSAEKPAFWVCRCDCGNIVDVRNCNLKSGNVKSCGCLYRDTRRFTKRTHGMTGSKLYMAWLNMKARCYNKNGREYTNYGGRGISVCSEWKDDSSAFIKWANENGYSDGLTLDRIDVNGDYCPQNCRWISNSEQQNNRRNNRNITYNGETKTLMQWANELGFCYKTLEKRIAKWGTERAFTEPIQAQHRTKGNTK